MPAQDELVNIYQTLKRSLKKYEPPLKDRMDLDARYDLWSVKEITVDGRKRDEVAFASLIIQSSYVGFYFMPVYSHPEAKEFFHPGMLRLLKGKSCFHIKNLTPALLAQIEEALEKGFRLYKERGWI